ncbi:MAG: DUF975 family protein [Butyrivibrio sp.]|nr:DUF975 family protein [Muribaculum sp.]MCM1551495.1 DUF975 family protein [Butyrivibrio sp.]
MNQDSTFLSGAVLKDRAKGALEGNYGKFILAMFSIGMITMVAQLIVTLTGAVFFSMGMIIREMQVNHLTLQQIQLLLDNGALIDGYEDWYNALNYVLNLITSFFTAVFNVGLSLFCLNLACGRRLKTSDIFYGFQTQFGKSLKLACVMVLVSELCYLPAHVLSYLIERNAAEELILSAGFLYAICIVIYVPCSLAISQVFLLLLDFPGYSAGELIRLSAHVMKGHKRRLFYIQVSFFPLILLCLLTLGIGNLWLTPYMNITYTFFFLNLMQAREQAH